VILRLDNLTRSFGSLKAVDGVHLEIAQGEALGIIGPNGAGKSTLFNLITGLLKPDTGTVQFDGHDITHAPPRVRCIAGIGRSFQIPHPFENLTVFENLLVAAIHGRKQPEAKVVDACGDILERTGLIAFANGRAGTLNLLGRKRLELARALASTPRLRGRMRRARRADTGHQTIRRDHRVDRTHRACARCSRFPIGGVELRTQNRRRRATLGHGLGRGQGNLYGHCGVRHLDVRH
jgi:ABC-type transport system involved in cytochrome c biogenesis ATPase subunit